MLDSIVIDDTGLFNESSRNRRTSTTSTDPTAASMDRPPTNGYDKDHHDPSRVNPGRQPHS